MSESINLEELVDRLLLIATLNSTLVHFLLSSQIEGSVDPDRVDSLTQGLMRTRKWMEEATLASDVPASTANIMSLIVKRLSQIESLLPKLSERAKKAEAAGTPAQEILSILEGDTTNVRPVQSVVESTTGEAVVPLVETAPPPPVEPYKKVDVEDDEFGLIGQTERMIQQYSNRCHILLPLFWLEVVRELHKYTSNSPFVGDVIEIPARIGVRIAKGLLTEAPGARLLQDLVKKRPAESSLDPNESERIERAVAKYFTGVEGILKGDSPNPNDKLGEAQTALDGFDWGGPELEKRIIKRINQQVQESLQNAESGTDPQRQVIHAEVTKLLCKLQAAILAEPRFREILAQMKP
ncbi:MAG: hypothetical protein JSW61_04425 [Candidatus Thorarchaeota archaeon]|nr:MAG: hypothetical protein JSW61_04425 [Candidatus Thorarchaeota archaeon]